MLLEPGGRVGVAHRVVQAGGALNGTPGAPRSRRPPRPARPRRGTASARTPPVRSFGQVRRAGQRRDRPARRSSRGQLDEDRRRPVRPAPRRAAGGTASRRSAGTGELHRRPARARRSRGGRASAAAQRRPGRPARSARRRPVPRRPSVEPARPARAAPGRRTARPARRTRPRRCARCAAHRGSASARCPAGTAPRRRTARAAAAGDRHVAVTPAVARRRPAPGVLRRRRPPAPPSPSSSGRKVSTMTASSSKYSAPMLRLVRAGLRAVRVAAGVQRDRALADARALAGLVVAAARRTSPRRSRRWSGSTAPGSTAGGSRPCAARSCRSRSCAPSNTWCTGGGWWTRPVIGSKSATLNAYGYRQPSQPTTSNGWCGSTCTVPTMPPGPGRGA